MLELLLNIFYLVSSDNLSQLSFALEFFCRTAKHEMIDDFIWIVFSQKAN